MEKILKNELYKKLEKNSTLIEFIDSIQKRAELYLFGGAVRDFLVNNFDNFRDLDFVVKFQSNKDKIENFFPNNKKISYSKNKFDGYKIKFSNVSVDIWELKDTWNFTNPEDISPENLLNSVFLNLDKLLYSVNKKKYINNCDKEFHKILQEKYIDIQFEKNPFFELNILRCIHLKREYSLKYSEKIRTIFSEMIKSNSEIERELMNIQEYRNYPNISLEVIRNELKEIVI